MATNTFTVHTIRIAGLCLCLAVLCPAAYAAEIYQWTDENGVVHFSQSPPEESVEDMRTVNVDGGEGNNGLGISEQDDPEGYQAHREEMDALWSDLEERQEAARSQPEPQPAPEYIYVGNEWDYTDSIWPVYRPWPRPPNHRPRPPRPRPHDEATLRPPRTSSVPYRRP